MKDVLTAQEAADALGYNVDHLYRLLKDGTVKGQRLGREWMITREEVQRVRALQDEHGRIWKGQR